MNLSLNSHTPYAHLKRWVKAEFQPTGLFKSISSGLLIYSLEIIFAISFSALIFSGPLADQLPLGLGLIVFGDAVLIGIVALLSSLGGMISAEQDAPGAIMAIAALSMVAAMPASASSTQRMATVVIMIVGTSVLTGLFFILLGIFKMGGLVRFLPYPVIGGFLAGTGWSLATGGISFMVNSPINLEFLQPKLLLQWVPGLLLGAVILLASNRFKSPIVLPLMAIGATGIFYLIVWLTGTPMETLFTGGWLLGVMPSGNLWQFPLKADLLSQVDWHELWRTLPTLLSLPLISMVAMLLNTGGIELLVKKEINLSRELISTGIGNVLSGMTGGIIGYPVISLTSLNHTMNGNKRLPGLIVAALIGLTVFAGSAIFMYIPKMILGALLVYLGLAMLIEWVYQAWYKFPRGDALIILSILGIIIFSGFLQAVAVGLVMTILFFVINYSRIKVIKHTLSGASYRSRVTRSRTQQILLDDEGDQLYILKLQGYIFFGTANSLFEKVRERARQANLPPIRFVLLDFSQVTGLDSTGLLSFTKMLQFTRDQGITLVLTGLHGNTAAQFANGGFTDQPGVLQLFADIDHGAEWCENQILNEAQSGDSRPHTLAEYLQAIWHRPGQIDKLMGYMQRYEIAQGQYLMHQGDDPNLIYFIESGQVTAQLEVPGKPPMRFETMSGGRVVGELGFYLGTQRTAHVIADEPSVVYALRQSDLEEMEKNDPEAAYVFHRIIVHLMGERMTHLIKVVNALQD